MKIKKTRFKDLKIIDSPIHFDQRGHFREIFKKKFFIKKNFLFGCSSFSKKNVLRGLHMQKKFSQGKYVTVLKGKVLDVAVDLRKNSKTFGKHYKIILSSNNGKSIYIPPGFAHGFLGIKKENVIFYFCTNYRSAKNELGLRWNDKKLNINWSIKKPILSKKDKNNISLSEYIKFHA